METPAPLQSGGSPLRVSELIMFGFRNNSRNLFSQWDGITKLLSETSEFQKVAMTGMNI